MDAMNIPLPDPMKVFIEAYGDGWGIVSPGTELRVIWPSACLDCTLSFLAGVSQRRNAEFIHQIEIFLHKRLRMTRGQGDVLPGQVVVVAQLNAPEALNIVFNFIRTVKRLRRDLGGGLLLHQALVADDRLVGDRPAHVMDRPAAGDHVAAVADGQDRLL